MYIAQKIFTKIEELLLPQKFFHKSVFILTVLSQWPDFFDSIIRIWTISNNFHLSYAANTKVAEIL